MPKELSVRDRDYARLKAWCIKHGVSMAETVGQFVKTLEVKKVNIPETELVECGECGEEIPEDAVFCPYCGVEFEEDLDEEESE